MKVKNKQCTSDKRYLGNIKNTSIDEIRNSHICNKFVEVSKHIDPECPECKWFNLCREGCRRDREPFFEGKPALNYLCSAYRDFFDYAGERLHHLAGIMLR